MTIHGLAIIIGIVVAMLPGLPIVRKEKHMTTKQITAEQAFEAYHSREASCCSQCEDNCPHKPWEEKAYLAGWEESRKQEGKEERK